MGYVVDSKPFINAHLTFPRVHLIVTGLAHETTEYVVPFQSYALIHFLPVRMAKHYSSIMVRYETGEAVGRIPSGLAQLG